jgi:hypothetical protein
MRSVERSLIRIRSQIERVRELAKWPQTHLLCEENGVSGWCPAEHLDHMMKASISIMERLTAGAEPLPRGINVVGRAVLALGWIPRGVAKSPKRVLPTRVTPAVIEESAARFELLLNQLPGEAASSRSRTVPHPRFGGLTGPEALRFIAVHNDHHLKIVDDIVRTLPR